MAFGKAVYHDIDSNESFGKAIHRTAINLLVSLSTKESNESF